MPYYAMEVCPEHLRVELADWRTSQEAYRWRLEAFNDTDILTPDFVLLF